MKNINNILNDNLISTLDKRLRLAGYNNHIPFSELFSLYTNSGQVRDEIHTLYQYPENTYVDLLQGNTNTRGPSYVVSGTDILYSNYSYGTSTYTNFGSFISTPH